MRREGSSSDSHRRARGDAVKALTLHQPWATLVAIGVKRIETRSWSTKYRGPLAIHAAARVPGGPGHCFSDVGDYHPWDSPAGWALTTHTNQGDHWDLPLGAVLATCELVDVVPTTLRGPDGQPSIMGINIWDRSEDGAYEDPPTGRRRVWSLRQNRPYGDFSLGRFAWLLDEIEPLAESIPARGRQGLWEWER